MKCSRNGKRIKTIQENMIVDESLDWKELLDRIKRDRK